MRTDPTPFFQDRIATPNDVSVPDSKASRSGWGIAAALAILLTAGCATQPELSKLMEKSTPPAQPPPGKSLVLIHYPRGGGHSGVWDGTNFIADIGPKTSAAYVCEPGRHYFVNRSSERVSVLEAQLLPDKTYGMCIQPHIGWVTPALQIEPIKRGTKEWDKQPTWSKDHMWVTPGPTAAEHETLRRSEVQLILKDFVSGEKQDRLRHLGPEDHF